jgi:hypothetical protein
MTLFEMSCMSSFEKMGTCMEKAMVHLYVKSFIMNRSLHDLKGLGPCCRCGGY